MRDEQKKVGSRLGLIASVASILCPSSCKQTDEDLRKADFKTCSQRMGVRFTDKIRDTFRNRWLKKS